MTNIRRASVVAIAAALAITGCAATEPATGSRTNTIIAVQYGTVTNIEQVEMQANAAGGAALGGGIGLAAASTRSGTTQIGAAAAGALIGALIQRSRHKTADRFTVRLNNGNTVAIVSEHHEIALGDCVSMEQGAHANIRRVSPVMCDINESHPAYSQLHAANVEEADECHRAKEELLKASTEQDADIGYKKMRALCEH